MDLQLCGGREQVINQCLPVLVSQSAAQRYALKHSLTTYQRSVEIESNTILRKRVARKWRPGEEQGPSSRKSRGYM